MTVVIVEHQTGLFVVTYRENADLGPAENRSLVARLKASAIARGRRGAVVFEVGPAITGVELSVPTFWLSVTGAADCPICCMGIVTNAGGVRVAAKGFGLANQLRGVNVAVQPFGDTAAAVAWALNHLA